MPNTPDTSSEQSTSAIDKVLDILLMFDDERISLTIEDIQRELNVPQSSAYRYAKTLVDKGFLHKTGVASYQLGAVLVRMSKRVLQSDRILRSHAMPVMQRIAHDTRESVSLMRIMNQQVVCIASIEGQYALRVMIERGRTQPLHAGASSKVLLAHLPPRQIERVLQQQHERFTTATITDPEALRRSLTTIQQEGYALSDGEIDVGARAVAVPVFDEHGEASAALSIEAPQSRMDDEIAQHYIARLHEGAEQIRQSLQRDVLLSE
jgi:DNA-binding IclR family transcriptional regulator